MTQHTKLPSRARRQAALASMLTGILSLATPAGAASGVFGSLANFDVVNDTGYTAHGFEIELEGISRNHVTDVFGLNRNFGTPSPGDVERYGLPTVGDLSDGLGNITGVKITYAATFANGAWSTGTPSGPFNTPGESCWTFGNVGYPNVSCDHFGVSTIGNPTKTTYKWLIDPNNNGALQAAVVGIPAVNFTPSPAPVAGQPAPPPVAVIEAVANNAVDPRLNAYWVKIVQTSLPEEVDLNDLLGGNHQFAVAEIAALNEKPETEIEWQVLQPGMVDEVSKALDFGAGAQSAVIRYEFYRYLGTFDDEGLVDPKREEIPVGNTLNEFVGAYIGEQIAGFNPNQVAAVPEPETYAMLLAGLALVGGIARRRAR